MKSTLLASLALLTIPLTAAFADIAVYRGAVMTRVTSQSETDHSAARIVEVIDLTSGESVTLVLEHHGAQNTFDVHPVEQHVITAVGDGHGHDWTVIANAADTTDANGATVVDALVLKGSNVDAVIKGATHSSVAKALHGAGTVLTTAGAAADGQLTPARLVEATVTLSLQAELSRTINDAGEDLAAAVAHVASALTTGHFQDENEFEHAHGLTPEAEHEHGLENEHHHADGTEHHGGTPTGHHDGTSHH